MAPPSHLVGGTLAGELESLDGLALSVGELALHVDASHASELVTLERRLSASVNELDELKATNLGQGHIAALRAVLQE